jgi:hypothetical protein
LLEHIEQQLERRIRPDGQQLQLDLVLAPTELQALELSTQSLKRHTSSFPVGSNATFQTGISSKAPYANAND